MRITDKDGNAIEIKRENPTTLRIQFGGTEEFLIHDGPIFLDELGINLLIEGLRSAAEDMKHHREQVELDRLHRENRL